MLKEGGGGRGRGGRERGGHLMLNNRLRFQGFSLDEYSTMPSLVAVPRLNLAARGNEPGCEAGYAAVLLLFK